MATFATLPGDLLTAIASYIDGPQIVVAVASDADARAALRRGVDDAERARYTVTIRRSAGSVSRGGFLSRLLAFGFGSLSALSLLMRLFVASCCAKGRRQPWRLE